MTIDPFARLREALRPVHEEPRVCRVLSGFVLGPGRYAQVGDVLALSGGLAREYAAKGFVVIVTENPKKAEETATEAPAEPPPPHAHPVHPDLLSPESVVHRDPPVTEPQAGGRRGPGGRRSRP